MLSSCIVYMTQQYIVRIDSNRLKDGDLKNRPTENHVGVWCTVKAKQYIRLIDPVLCTLFFIFDSRFCEFEMFHHMLDRAIEKLGRF